MKDKSNIQSVAKAMELLQVLSSSGSPLTLTAIANMSGYPKSTVFGLLNTMREYDVVYQTMEGKYTLGFRLFEYGHQIERSWDISTVARPYMEHLTHEIGTCVTISVLSGSSVVTLDQVEARDQLRIVSDVGARLPLYCTSQGKVFLSSMSEKEAVNLLKRSELTQFTPHTITDVGKLMEEIEECRKNGYAIENGEYRIGLRSISAPVFNANGDVRYTIGVIGMFRSIHSEEFKQAIEKVCSTASMISIALGHRKKEMV